MRLFIIILNYRTPAFVTDCLDSLQGQLDATRDRVIVVDNASGDDSPQRIAEHIARERYSDWCELLRSPLNGGFSAGNNVGIRHANAEYVLLLNSDTIVRDKAIATLLQYAEQHPEAGLIGPRLEWPDGTAQESCFRSRSPSYEFFAAARTGWLERVLGHKGGTLPVSDQPLEVDWVSFACVLVRRQVFEQAGLMDEGYFMYFDDMDFCRTAKQQGFTIHYCPQARVVHLRGGSSPVKKLTAARKRPPRYLYASRNRYYAKFFGRFGLWRANLLWHAGRCLSLLREWIGNKQPHTNAKQWQDIWIQAWDPMKHPEIPGKTRKSREGSKSF